MTAIANPNSPPGPQALPVSSGPETACALLALCVECGQGTELPLPIDSRSLAFRLAQMGWFIAVMSPPGQGPEAPMIFGPLCAACAQQVYTPEVFAAAEQRRQQLLQAAQASQAAQAGQGPR